MTTKATANKNQFTQVTTTSNQTFLIQNVQTGTLFIMVLAEGIDPNNQTEDKPFAIQLLPGQALNRSVVGDGIVWVSASEDSYDFSLTMQQAA